MKIYFSKSYKIIIILILFANFNGFIVCSIITGNAEYAPNNVRAIPKGVIPSPAFLSNLAVLSYKTAAKFVNLCLPIFFCRLYQISSCFSCAFLISEYAIIYVFLSAQGCKNIVMKSCVLTKTHMLITLYAVHVFYVYHSSFARGHLRELALAHTRKEPPLKQILCPLVRFLVDEGW